jgi:hypothetical protein
MLPNTNVQSVMNLRQLLSSANTEERTVVYHGVAVTIVSQMIPLLSNGMLATSEKGSMAKAYLFIKDFVLGINEIAIIDRTLLEKIIKNRLSFYTDFLNPNEIMEQLFTFKDFDDTFKFHKYFGCEEIELVNKNMVIFRKSIQYTKEAINYIMPEID